ncbi:MAG: hypothetical protein JWN34_738 [Bryobacterales bacterium]|jgi:hypothetical protein|nr:hypothetical protein [Bryobacterales bacterium]
MPKLLHCLSRCYRATLWLYPPDLRREHGDEMAAAFSALLADQSAQRGWRGVIQAALCAGKEILTVAVPGQLASEWMAATTLLLAVNLASIIMADIFLRRLCS